MRSNTETWPAELPADLGDKPHTVQLDRNLARDRVCKGPDSGSKQCVSTMKDYPEVESIFTPKPLKDKPEL